MQRAGISAPRTSGGPGPAGGTHSAAEGRWRTPGVGVRRETAGEEPAEQPRLGTGKSVRPRAYPPWLGESKPSAPAAPLRSAQLSGRAGPATGLVCPASPPAVASLSLAVPYESAGRRDRERWLLGFGGGGGGVGRRAWLGGGITRPQLAGAACRQSGGAPLQVPDSLWSFIGKL